MNGQEAVVIPTVVGENFEPQAKRQKVEGNGEEQIVNFQTLMSPKSIELGKLCDIL